MQKRNSNWKTHFSNLIEITKTKWFSNNALNWSNTTSTAHSRALNKKYLQAANVLNNHVKKNSSFFYLLHTSKKHRNRTIRNSNFVEKKLNMIIQIIQYHRNSTFLKNHIKRWAKFPMCKKEPVQLLEARNNWRIKECHEFNPSRSTFTCKTGFQLHKSL